MQTEDHHDHVQFRPRSRSSTPERRLYRQGSIGSTYSSDGVQLPLGHMRRRTPSGQSIRSRTASRAEYHHDLKIDLTSDLTWHLCFQALIIWLGTSYLFGYNIGVLNQPTALIKDFYNQTYSEREGQVISEYKLLTIFSITTAIYFPGGMIGAYLAGFLADKWGRKRTVLFCQLFGLIGAVMSTVTVVAKTPELLIIGRFITGFSCGVGAQLAPMYLAEITPVNLRGAFGTGNQLFVTIGIFTGSVFGLREILGTEDGWPYLLLLNAAPALVCLIVLPFLPESPRFSYISNNKKDEAEKALMWLRQKEDVSADLEEMETESLEGLNEPTYTMAQLLKTKDLHMPLFIAIVLMVAQQFSGINCIFFYSSGIFLSAGVAASAIQYAVMATNAVNVLMTLIVVPIMDKAGRRPLLLYPMIVMTIDMAVITAALNLQGTVSWLSYLSIMCVLIYVIAFALGLGPIPWMIGAEIFRQGPRSKAMSLAGAVNWVCSTIIAISFELIQKAIGEFTFIIFMCLMILFTLFVFFKVPETKNKTFEEIANIFQPGGDIEVEEIYEEPVVRKPNLTIDALEKDTLMKNGDARVRNGSVSSVDKGGKIGNGDRMSLTRSEEKINIDVS